MPGLDRPCKDSGLPFKMAFQAPAMATGRRLREIWGGFIEQLRGGTWELKLSDVPGLQVQAEQWPQ